MNLVTDTHALIWYAAGESRRLSARARRAFDEAEAGHRTIFVPTVVLMEMALLEARGRIQVAYRDLREQLALRPGLPLEPLLADDVDEARSLAELRDPFDRLIAGTAARLGVPLLTMDQAITSCRRVRCYW